MPVEKRAEKDQSAAKTSLTDVQTDTPRAPSSPRAWHKHEKRDVFTDKSKGDSHVNGQACRNDILFRRAYKWLTLKAALKEKFHIRRDVKRNFCQNKLWYTSAVT